MKTLINIAFLTILLVQISKIVNCSILEPGLAPIPIHYTRIAPPNVSPFAASVNTFTKGLNILDAPYAAGVLPTTPYFGGAPIVPPAYYPTPFGYISTPYGPYDWGTRSVHAFASRFAPVVPAPAPF